MQEKVVGRVQVMQEMAHALDPPSIGHGRQELPLIQYWKHLFEEFREAFDLPQDVAKKCQLASEDSPSRNMFEHLKSKQPDFLISNLIEGLRDIQRNDLVKLLEQSSLPSKL